MSRTTSDWRGIIVELDDAETANLLNTIAPLGGGGAAAVAAALGAMGVPAYAAGIVGAAIAVHVAWESAAIRMANQGNGVILTFIYGTPGVAIPSTRFPADINQNWVIQQPGTFVSPGGDRIEFRVDNGAVDPAIVRFRLINQNQSRWDKSFVLRDGLGSQWEIRSTVAGLGQEDLWAAQVLNGQQITFRKPSFGGWWIDVLSVGGIQALQPGDQATFTWVQD